MPLYDASNKVIPGTDDSAVIIPKRFINEINKRTLRIRELISVPPTKEAQVEVGKLQQEVGVLMAKLLLTLGIESGQPIPVPAETPHGTA